MTRKWTSEKVLDTARGFQEAAVCIAAAELDLFTVLKGRALTAAETARRIKGDGRGTAILLDALVAMGLLSKARGRYRAAASAAAVLAEGGGDCALGMVRHLGNCMRRWGQLAAVIRSGRPPARSPSIRGQADDTVSFIRAMHEISEPVAGPLVRSLRPRFRHLLDLGGADGTWTVPFLRACPKGRATIFDLPAVAAMARRRMRQAGLAGRVRVAAGDLHRDRLPGGCDLAWVSAIVHMNSRAQNRAMFAKVFAALVGGGRIWIRDVVMDGSRTRPAMGALFAVNMLTGTAGGGTFTFGELAEDLAAEGFVRCRFVRRGQAMDSVVEATRPAG